MKKEIHHKNSHQKREANNHPHEHHEHSKKSTQTKLKRLFERGDLQLLILAQLKTTTSHGYELIKSINHLTHGLYEPSPGVVYPTLSMLEDQGFIRQEITDSSKKMYSITEEGILHLEQCQARFSILKERLSSINAMKESTNFSSAIDQAIRNFKMLMRHQLRHEKLSPVQIEKIVSIINYATQEIENINNSETTVS